MVEEYVLNADSVVQPKSVIRVYFRVVFCFFQISDFVFEGVAGYGEKAKAVRWEKEYGYGIKRVVLL